jgi:hypothetical protein
MQGNEPLMRALSKLINLNKPDLVRSGRREGAGAGDRFARRAC